MFHVLRRARRRHQRGGLVDPPGRAILYILASLVVFFVNFDQIGQVFGEIFAGAFGTHAVYGAIIGLAIKWGVQRGIYSNEAGQGTGPHHAAAAEVSHPAKQGFVQAFSVYIDTLFVCTATAFIILSTDMYTVFKDEEFGSATHYVGKIGTDVEPGPGFVQAGFDTLAPGLGSSFVALALAFFAFTTMIAYYYMAEVNLSYLTRKISSGVVRRGMIRGLQLLILCSVAYGAVTTAGSAWGLGDIGVGTMAWLNIVGILARWAQPLAAPARRAADDPRRPLGGVPRPVLRPSAHAARRSRLHRLADRRRARGTLPRARSRRRRDGHGVGRGHARARDRGLHRLGAGDGSA